MKRSPTLVVALALTVLATLFASAQTTSPREGEKTPCQLRIEELQRYYEKYGPPPPSFGFPPIPEIEYENSLITFRICRVKKNLTPEQEERRKKSWKCCDPEFYDVQVVRLDAYMRLCREAPVLNELGFRELRFTIERWELFGHARLFDGDIVFSATPNVVQPKSLAFRTESFVPATCRDLTGGISASDTCSKALDPKNLTERAAASKRYQDRIAAIRAKRTPSAGELKPRRGEDAYWDFPAMIVYNAIYDVWLNGRKLVSTEPGIAMARGAMQIPPTAITVAFQKPVETTLPDGTIIKICPGTCSGMVTIPEHVFWRGIETADAIKAGRLKLAPDWQPEAVKRPAPKPQ